MVGAGAAQDPPGKEGLASLTARPAHARRGDALGRGLRAHGGVARRRDRCRRRDRRHHRERRVPRRRLRRPVSICCGRCCASPPSHRDEVRRARDEQLADLIATLEDPSAVAEKCFAAFLYGPYPYGRLAGRQPDERLRPRARRRARLLRALVSSQQHDPVGGRRHLGGGRARARARGLRRLGGPSRCRTEPRPDRPTPLTARRVLLVDKPDATPGADPDRRDRDGAQRSPSCCRRRSPTRSSAAASAPS